MSSQRKLLLAAAISALILACALCVVLIAWFFLGENSNPSAPPSPAQATVTPENQLIPLEIQAMIDGSDVLNITPSGVTLRHISWQPPPFMTLNDKRFYPDSHRTLAQVGLSDADLSTATVVSRHGRGTVALEKTSTGIAIHFADPQSGAAPYRIALIFLPKSQQPTRHPPQPFPRIPPSSTSRPPSATAATFSPSPPPAQPGITSPKTGHPTSRSTITPGTSTQPTPSMKSISPTSISPPPKSNPRPAATPSSWKKPTTP